MANIKGTNILSAITPFTTEDEYATHYAKYGRGGWQEVETIADRDAITEDRREAGMAVYVLATKKTYILDEDLITWNELESGKVDDVKVDGVSVVHNKVAEIDLSGKLDKVDTPDQVYGTDENGDQTTYNVDSFGKVDDVQVNGVSVVTNKIAEVTVPTKVSELDNDSGYLTSVGEGTLTIQKNGTAIGTFNANQNNDATINIEIPAQVQSNWTEADNTKADYIKNKPAVIDNLTSSSATDVLSANQGKVLQDEIEALSGRGRFLSVWNCATGLPETNPQQSPYEYHNGDYFIVGTVAASGGTNYKPDGSSYTTGVASTTVETESVEINDTYIYDGTVWHLQQNAQREVSFSSIAGSPYDNTNLASALNDKADATDIGNAVLTIQKNSTQVGTFTANSKTDTTINISVPTKTSEITNDSGYITAPTITYNAQTEELTIS